MAAGTWTVTNTARTKILNGTFNSGDTYKMALFDKTSNLDATATAYSSVTGEVDDTDTGYTTGGVAVVPVLSGTTSVDWNSNNPQWTAGSADLTAKFAAIYEVGGDVLAFVLLDSGGADVTCTEGNTLTVDCTTNPVFTLE